MPSNRAPVRSGLSIASPGQRVHSLHSLGCYRTLTVATDGDCDGILTEAACDDANPASSGLHSAGKPAGAPWRVPQSGREGLFEAHDSRVPIKAVASALCTRWMAGRPVWAAKHPVRGGIAWVGSIALSLAPQARMPTRNLMLPMVAVAATVAAAFSVRRALLPALGDVPAGTRAEAIAALPMFRSGRLRNTLPLDESLEAVGRAIFGERSEATQPESPLEYPADPLPETPGAFAVSWLGHSTVVLDLDGERVLFDPMFGERASPVSFAGPARYLRPPLALSEVGPVDVVLVSHDHYDHLEMLSVQALSDAGSRFIVPTGIGARLEGWGVSTAQITELSWWEEASVGALRVVSTPARHFSGRDALDRFGTLWTGWAILGTEHSVLFTGDTGMGPHFAEIGARLGPFSLTMPEVGSYDAAWTDVHLGPEQALAAHRALGSDRLLPVHWAAFVMGNHSWTEPGERLLAAATPEDGLLLPPPGMRVDFTAEPSTWPTTQWWPDTPFRTAAQAPIVSTGL
ncbi:MAG TPA: hypothetical protein DFR83_01520 [Deltaproteobacteria bacterium]|nr:hypothetical protein [Deltaproteobacteria bacterium]